MSCRSRTDAHGWVRALSTTRTSNPQRGGEQAELAGRVSKAPHSKAPPRSLALALVVAGMLSACSDIYYDRRETIALGADDHIASNTVVQMIDPWPRYVGNKNLAFNGDRMQAAADRYRRNCVIPPVPIATTQIGIQQQLVQAQAANCLPAGTAQAVTSSQGTGSQWSSQTTPQVGAPVASK